MRCLAVTCNAAIDTTYVLDRFAPGEINRVARVTSVPGGKGNNVARVLATLGNAVVATGFAGGHAGRFIAGGLATAGVEPAFVPVDGESRVCLTLVESATGVVTEIREPGLHVAAEDADRLVDRVAALSRNAEAVVVSGSLPPGLPDDFYAQLVVAARAGGAFVALDSSGGALRRGITGRPDLIAPNRDELAALLDRPADLDVDDLIAAVRADLLGAILAPDARVLLSLGAAGAVVIRQCDAVWAKAPETTVVNTVGCGDALLAGFLDARFRGADDADALAAAVAVGTAAALQEEIGAVSVDDIARLRPGVRVREPAARSG